MEAPRFELNIHRQYKPYNVITVGIDLYDGAPALVQSRFVTPTGITFPILTYGSSVARVYGASTDAYFVVDTTGTVVYISRSQNITTLQQALDTVTSIPGGFPDAVPSAFHLKQNYPNPFNPETTIEYELRAAQPQMVEMEIYDVLGKRIRLLVREYKSSGFHKTTWDGRADDGKVVPAGAYFYQLRSPEKTETRRMVLLR